MQDTSVTPKSSAISFAPFTLFVAVLTLSVHIYLSSPHLLTISIMCHYLIVTATVPRHTHVAAHTSRGFPNPTTSSIKSMSPLSLHQSQALRERNMPSVITLLKQGPEAWDCLQLMDPRSDRPSVAPHLRQVWSPGPSVREEYSALSAPKSSLLKGTSQTEIVLRKHNVCATFWQARKVHMPKIFFFHPL